MMLIDALYLAVTSQHGAVAPPRPHQPLVAKRPTIFLLQRPGKAQFTRRQYFTLLQEPRHRHGIDRRVAAVFSSKAKIHGRG